MANEFTYAVVLRHADNRHSDGGAISSRRRLREGAKLEHEGRWWRVDHIVLGAEPPLVYLIPAEAI